MEEADFSGSESESEIESLISLSDHDSDESLASAFDILFHFIVDQFCT